MATIYFPVLSWCLIVAMLFIGYGLAIDSWGSWIVGTQQGAADRRCNMPPSKNNNIVGWLSKGCKTLTPSYFYNRFTGKCENFASCGANRNFATRQECEIVCHDSDPLAVRHVQQHRIAPASDDSSRGHASKKSFLRVMAALRTNKSILSAVCYLPVVTGSCNAPGRMFFYDLKRGRCVEFMYSGCGGNQNKFRFMADCQRTCSLPLTSASGVVAMEKGHNDGDDSAEDY